MPEDGKRVVIYYYKTERISPTSLSSRLKEELEARGWEVVHRYMTSTEKKFYVEDNQLPVVIFMERGVSSLLVHQQVYRPKGVLSIQIDNWEDIPLPDALQYLACFVKPKFGTIPVQHLSPTDYALRGMMHVAKRYLAPSCIRAMQTQVGVCGYGMEDKFFPGDNDPDRLVVPYSWPDNTQKNIKRHNEVTSKYHAWAAQQGLDVSTDFLTTKGAAKKLKKRSIDQSVYTVKPSYSDRQELATGLRQYGMFLCTSAYESFGMYYVELLLSGVVGIFQDTGWPSGLVPGYRFVVPTSELLDTMIWVRQNYEEARRYVLEEVAPMLRERYAMSTYVDRVESILDDFVRR